MLSFTMRSQKYFFECTTSGLCQKISNTININCHIITIINKNSKNSLYTSKPLKDILRKTTQKIIKIRAKMKFLTKI